MRIPLDEGSAPRSPILQVQLARQIEKLILKIPETRVAGCPEVEKILMVAELESMGVTRYNKHPV